VQVAVTEDNPVQSMELQVPGGQILAVAVAVVGVLQHMFLAVAETEALELQLFDGQQHMKKLFQEQVLM
jgi:hypothetical protein